MYINGMNNLIITPIATTQISNNEAAEHQAREKKDNDKQCEDKTTQTEKMQPEETKDIDNQLKIEATQDKREIQSESVNFEELEEFSQLTNLAEELGNNVKKKLTEIIAKMSIESQVPKIEDRSTPHVMLITGDIFKSYGDQLVKLLGSICAEIKFTKGSSILELNCPDYIGKYSEDIEKTSSDITVIYFNDNTVKDSRNFTHLMKMLSPIAKKKTNSLVVIFFYRKDYDGMILPIIENTCKYELDYKIELDGISDIVILKMYKKILEEMGYRLANDLTDEEILARFKTYSNDKFLALDERKIKAYFYETIKAQRGRLAENSSITYDRTALTTINSQDLAKVSPLVIDEDYIQQEFLEKIPGLFFPEDEKLSFISSIIYDNGQIINGSQPSNYILYLEDGNELCDLDKFGKILNSLFYKTGSGFYRKKYIDIGEDILALAIPNYKKAYVEEFLSFFKNSLSIMDMRNQSISPSLIKILNEMTHLIKGHKTTSILVFLVKKEQKDKIFSSSISTLNSYNLKIKKSAKDLADICSDIFTKKGYSINEEAKQHIENTIAESKTEESFVPEGFCMKVINDKIKNGSVQKRTVTKDDFLKVAIREECSIHFTGDNGLFGTLKFPTKEHKEVFDKTYPSLMNLKWAPEIFKYAKDLIIDRIHNKDEIISKKEVVVITGNSGLGKTTNAKLLSDLLYSLGYIGENNFVSSNPSLLLNGKGIISIAISKAQNGVLFIDEAHTLFPRDTENDKCLGFTVIESIVSDITNSESKTSYIFAGYPGRINPLINSDQGMKSRITREIHIEDPSSETLLNLVEHKAKDKGYTIDEKLLPTFKQKIRDLKDYEENSFGNIRSVENLLNYVISTHNRRTQQENELNNKEITKEDIENTRVDGKPSRAKEENIAELTRIQKIKKESESWKALHEMEGVDSVKKYVEILYQRMISELKRALEGHRISKSIKRAQHLMLLGSPGTGKTTVADLIGNILHDLGIIPKSRVTKVSHNELISRYANASVTKTQSVINNSSPGVIFIDEAYFLYSGDNEYHAGKEVVTTLLLEMEKKRPQGEDVIFIFAGYANKMQPLISSNPGLRSRVSIIELKDLKIDSLVKIATDHLAKQEYTLEDGAEKILKAKLEQIKRIEGDNFGNGRSAKKLANDIMDIYNSKISSQIHCFSDVKDFVAIEDDRKISASIIEEVDFPDSDRDISESLAHIYN